MKTPFYSIKNFALIAGIMLAFTSCKKDDKEKPSIRTAISYSVLTPTTPYKSTFLDASGQTTVDFTTGNTRYKMFQALNDYAKSATSVQIEANTLKNMFSNSGTPFTGDYASLNGTGIQLRNIIASSKSVGYAEAARLKFDTHFAEMAAISLANGVTASKGVAGKLENRLVDARGMETAQIIQKSLIGALQLDYIGNVLLNTNGLNAENYTVVSGKNYTQLEQNWDQAYAFLTLNPIYLAGSTNDLEGTTEFGLGSYVWEDNKANYAKIYPAFLKGRAAIVNNDKAELQVQATFIRTQFELAIATAAVRYLTEWGTSTTDASKAHAIGEGAGFIYSLRFCSLNGADAAFSDGILTALLSPTGGFWDLTQLKVETTKASIKAKFNIQ